MALHVLAYNLTRVMTIMDIQPLMAQRSGHNQPEKLPLNASRQDRDTASLPAKRFYTTKTLNGH